MHICSCVYILYVWTCGSLYACVYACLCALCISMASAYNYVCCACMCAYFSVYVCACTCRGVCGGQRTACQTLFSLSTMWDSGIELRTAGLTTRSFYTLSHLAGLSLVLLWLSMKNSYPIPPQLVLGLPYYSQSDREKVKYQNGKAISGPADMKIHCQNLSKCFILDLTKKY